MNAGFTLQHCSYTNKNLNNILLIYIFCTVAFSRLYLYQLGLSPSPQPRGLNPKWRQKPHKLIHQGHCRKIELLRRITGCLGHDYYESP